MSILKFAIGIFFILAASRLIPHPPNFTSLIALSFYVPLIFGTIYIPIVLISYVRAFQKEFPEHKKISKITFPIWLYVAVTGVIVYIMISPYY